MGFFSKVRTGHVECHTVGRKYTWIIPNVAGVKFNTVLDGDLLTSYQGVEFHFHLIVGLKGDLGFYLHHKREHIPKYSFYFMTEDGHTLRQHTAHTIPKDTERCGHWNVCNVEDLKRLMSKPDGELRISFCFDNDYLEAKPVPGEDGAKNFVWHLPTPRGRFLDPFSSPSFSFNGVFYIIRLDKKAGSETDYNLYVFSRNALVPPHDICIMNDRHEVIKSVPKTEDMTTQLLPITVDDLDYERVYVSVNLHRGGNPLDILNSPEAAGATAAAPKEVHPDDAKAKKYGIAMDDL